MRDLIEEYGAAVAARGRLERDGWLESHQVAGQPLRDAKERERAAREALEDAVRQVSCLVSQAVGETDKIHQSKFTSYSIDNPDIMKAHHGRRAFTLADARPIARHTAKLLREAWDLLDPSIEPFKAASNG